MADLVPQALDPLLRRMAHELAHGACFDLPARSFHRAPEGLDLSVRFHGERAANALGPAAGPQSQLAQNLVLSYLAGARVFELKTVQVLDQLTLPRPCIDAANLGFNVEWSQELRLAQSRAEYVKAWVLLHALRSAKLGLGLEGPGGEFLFDLSVGYDLAGVRSGPVREFLEGMLDARAEIDALFDAWPNDLRAWRPDRAAVPDRISSNVTLSTFHGCPADEVERIGEHLLTEVGTHVVVKLNPTVMGYEPVRALLRGRLGYEELEPHAPSFARELRFDDAVQLADRLSGVASAHGRTFGAKFTNTLVVENHRQFFPATEKQMYLSGPPLHVLALELSRAFRNEVRAPVPVSFSGGVDARNFADCVAAGLAPVTTCTDLLKPGGYGRLPRYLDALGARMRLRGVATVADFILAESGRSERAASPALVEQASRENHARAARQALDDPRYRAARNRAVPRRVGTRLWLFDCLSCDKCVPACPNDANFSIEAPPALRKAIRLPDLVVRGGQLVEENERLFTLRDAHQLATYADFCNECGNCDTFCPEEGGPYLVKPRFFANRQRMEASPRDGFALERTDAFDLITGRHDGQRLTLEVDRARTVARFDDGQAVVLLSFPGFERRALEPRAGAAEGHVVRLDRARALAVLLCGLVAEGASSPVVAPFLPPMAPGAVRV